MTNEEYREKLLKLARQPPESGCCPAGMNPIQFMFDVIKRDRANDLRVIRERNGLPSQKGE